MSVTDWRLEARVQLDQPLDDDTLEQLMDDAEHAAIGLDVSRDPIGLTLIAYYRSDELPTVALQRHTADGKRWLAEHGISATLADARVQLEALHDVEATTPDTPELLGPGEVAELLGVSRQRVHQLAGHRLDFPAPYTRLGIGPVWTRPAIEAFRDSWARKPGRPARAAG